MSRADRLRAYIEETAGEPSVWGADASDCSSWVARWIELERGVKLALPLYRSEEEGRRVIAEAGGLVNVWNGILGDAGISSCLEPQLGDVGVIEMRFGASGCIFGSEGKCFIRGANGAAVLGIRRWHILSAYQV